MVNSYVCELRLLKIEDAGCSHGVGPLPAFRTKPWTYRAHPASMDAIIAQNKAKKNLDFGKRAQKSAMLTGGVAAYGV